MKQEIFKYNWEINLYFPKEELYLQYFIKTWSSNALCKAEKTDLPHANVLNWTLTGYCVVEWELKGVI